MAEKRQYLKNTPFVVFTFIYQICKLALLFN